MVCTIRTLLFLAICLVISCAQTPAGEKLIDDINAAKVKARRFGDDAERKGAEPERRVKMNTTG
jgi:hypothetical protein